MDGGEPIMIFGRVARGDGSPLAEAAVTLCDLAGDQLDRTTTDRDGQYQLVPPSGGTYLVICSSAHRQPQATLVALSDRPMRHDLTLTGGGATLGGRVTSAAGEPAADVVLTLTDLRGAVVAVSRTAADGTYSFADVSEGAHTLTAAAPHLAPTAATVQVPADGHVAHDITTAGRAHLDGVVRSAAASRPVPEALATLVAADGTVAGAAVTGTDGTFRFDDVADGVYTLTASGYAPVATEVEVGAGRPADVELVLAAPQVDGPEVDGPADAPSGRGAGSHEADDRWDDPTAEFSPAALRRAAAHASEGYGTEGYGTDGYGTDGYGTDGRPQADGHHGPDR